ncbi:MAG: hypothetical protein REI78_02670 [Pedobacter sp.]|nr:hypothetical protein [Pedobacter sp.]
MKNNRLAFILIGILAIAILAGGAYIYTGTSDKNLSSEKEGKKKKKSKKDKAEPVESTESADCFGGTPTAQQIWELPKKLLEVSGIAWLGSSKVAMVQDQLGTIFIYDMAAKKVERKLPFGPNGDYEGIANVGGTFYVVRSDGNLFEISSSGKLIKQHQLGLTTTDNIETLHHDAQNNRLILGQKDGKKGATEKHFYSFDLKSKQMAAAPIFSIRLDDPIVSCENVQQETGKKKGKKKSGGSVIRPSELAIHPTTKEIYIADGPNQRILILTSGFTPKHYLSVDKKEFPQVEGLMFSPQGELYISTEGIKEPAKLAKMQLGSK